MSMEFNNNVQNDNARNVTISKRQFSRAQNFNSY